MWDVWFLGQIVYTNIEHPSIINKIDCARTVNFFKKVENGPCENIWTFWYGLTYLNVPNFYGLWLDVDIETFYHTGRKIVIFSSFLHALCPYDPSIGTVIQILDCTDRIKGVFPFLYAFAEHVFCNFFLTL